MTQHILERFNNYNQLLNDNPLVDISQVDIESFIQQINEDTQHRLSANNLSSILSKFLIIAASNGYTETAALLLSRADINVNQVIADGLQKGFSPLLIAVRKDKIEVIKLLLEHQNIDVNQVTPQGSYPLIMSI